MGQVSLLYNTIYTTVLYDIEWIHVLPSGLDAHLGKVRCNSRKGFRCYSGYRLNELELLLLGKEIARNRVSFSFTLSISFWRHSFQFAYYSIIPKFWISPICHLLPVAILTLINNWKRMTGGVGVKGGRARRRRRIAMWLCWALDRS